MSVQFKTPSATSIAKGIITYLKMVVGMAAVAGGILGSGYSELGQSAPDISEIGSRPDSMVPGADLVLSLFEFVAQQFATFTYEVLFWIPFPVFGLLTMALIAYFGIYRVGEPGWWP